ncbi:peptidoglycan editing factor PgeF [Bartonella sp. LJL80]
MTHRTSPVFSPALSTLRRNNIIHGFFTRKGGVSEGIYKSLNVGQGSSDDPKNVDINRQIVANSIGVDVTHLVNAYQIHSPEALIVEKPFTGERPKADALVSNVPGLALAVLTADCGPILFTDHKAGVVAAAHAGWRGALGGVVENTVETMEKLGAQRSEITAVLGPCIGPRHYEVTNEFLETFTAQRQDYACFFTPTEKDDHFLFNLWGFIIHRFDKAGIKGESLDICTYADEERFFSYRRKTHRNEPDYGRQISVIMLENTK